MRGPYEASNVKVYVISVKTYRDRHEHIAQLSSALGFDYEYIFKFDADDLSAEDRGRVSTSLSNPSASNALKHVEAQRMLLSSEEDVALVLEDDVLPYPTFAEGVRLALEAAASKPPGWLIFLGGGDNKLSSEFLGAKDFDLVKAKMTTAEAYLIDRAGCEKRLQWIEDNLIDCQADHLLTKVDFAIGNSHFCLGKPVCSQGSITGKFETRLDSSRRKHSSLYLRLRYLFNRFRRQLLPRLIHRLVEKIGVER